MKNIYITSAKRTAVGSLGKSLKNIKAEDLGSAVISNVINDSKLKKDEIEDLYDNAFKIVQYGWKKEAVPFIHEKKSLIARFFDLIFK